MREIPLEELPKNSWQVAAYENGKSFYGDPRSEAAIRTLQERVEQIERDKRARAAIGQAALIEIME